MADRDSEKSAREAQSGQRGQDEADTSSPSSEGMRGSDRAGDQGLGSSATKGGIDGDPRTSPESGSGASGSSMSSERVPRADHNPTRESIGDEREGDVESARGQGPNGASRNEGGVH